MSNPNEIVAHPSNQGLYRVALSVAQKRNVMPKIIANQVSNKLKEVEAENALLIDKLMNDKISGLRLNFFGIFVFFFGNRSIFIVLLYLQKFKKHQKNGK